ncbi:TIGR00730 family Rossman fold protein [Chitinispirillales bacterium ANBcel5]|uniref:LOG family protein n=1 Tax=Cellulosispirillum alkaliphilum TaxID=3039283 RepID=UPI002A597808|nr:TIGR00730 family Rossman fold protein [Chitinispirillales bacterium ANBcel5]
MSVEQTAPSVHEDTWRIFRIMAEFVDGFETLSSMGPNITIFGSARTAKNHEHYKMTVETARLAAKEGYGVITGGGPGIMEAANKGASMENGSSIGLNISLPFEQMPNPHIKTLINFKHFFIRKVMFLKYTSAVIIMPGGYGTLDELFETLTLVQTQKVAELPLILMGKDFWKGLLDWLNDTMLAHKYILPADMSLMKMTDDPAEAIDMIKKHGHTKEVVPNFV